MSLINRMLQDLDARRPELGPRSKLPNEVRPLPKARGYRLLWLAVLALVIAGAAGFAFSQLNPRPPAVSAPTMALTVLSPAPAEPEPVPAVQSEPPVATPPSAAGETGLFFDGSLRLADRLSSEAVKKTEAKPASRAVPTAPVSSARALPAPKATRAETAAPAAEAADQPASLASLAPGTTRSLKPTIIEKTDAVGSPRERAESEYRKAVSVVNRGRVSEAIDALRLALQYDKQHVAARQLLVKFLLEAGRGDEAMLALREGLQAQPAQLGWAMSLARLQLERGDLAAAWQTLDASLPAAGRSADYQGFAAHVLQRLGRNREAAEYYLAATQLSPGEGRWWLGLGLALDADGRSTEARDAFVLAKASGTLSAELVSLTDQKLR